MIDFSSKAPSAKSLQSVFGSNTFNSLYNPYDHIKIVIHIVAFKKIVNRHESKEELEHISIKSQDKRIPIKIPLNPNKIDALLSQFPMKPIILSRF